MLLSISGDCIHLWHHSSNPYDNGARLNGLADVGGMASGPVRALHRGGCDAAVAIQFAGPAGLLRQPGRPLY